MNIKCLILDDNIDDLMRVTKAVRKEGKNNGLELEITLIWNPEDSRILGSCYDLYFLDIGMPDQFGFELARKINRKYPRAFTVFCTNYIDLVFDAFKLDTLFFVKKCDLEKDVASAMQKYVRKCRALFGVYPYGPKKHMKYLALWEIVYFEVLGNEMFIHMKTGEVIEERRSMKAVQEKVENSGLFLGLDRNYLVNMKYITLITEKELFVDGQKFDIPKSRLKYVTQKYVAFLQGAYV